MTILDIDQDFFFYPTFYGGIYTRFNKSRAEVFSEMKRVHSVEEVLFKFSVNSLPGKMLMNHHELYYELSSLSIKEARIIHLDAHSDLYDLNMNESRFISPSNFLLKCIETGITHEIDWIHQDAANPKPPDENLKTGTITHFNHKFSLIISKLSDYQTLDQIDRLYYTLSPGFCPPDFSLVNEIRKHIIK